MIPQVARLYHPEGPDRVAVVSAQPSHNQEGHYLIHAARGPNRMHLTGGGAYGPYSEHELAARFAEVVGALKAEGFVESGLHDLLAKLHSVDPAQRASAALRLGWMKAESAVAPLLKLSETAVDELCSVLDALGRIGDARAIEVLRKQAARKLLSRRRSAIEALRGVGDDAGLAEALQTTQQRLPEPIRGALDAPGTQSENLLAALEQGETKRLGLHLDAIYEIGDPACVLAVRVKLSELSYAQPFVWRYVKSILKRSMLRGDDATFGLAAYQIENQSRFSKGTQAQVKSGHDGQVRNTPIFQRNTQLFVRRSTWRYLRQLAKHRPERYALAAAEVLLFYCVADARDPKGALGRFAACWMLNQILHGASSRFVADNRRLLFRFRGSQYVKPPAGVREERFPELWDAAPQAYLRLLQAANLPEVHQFAIRAIERDHPDLLQSTKMVELLALLQAPHEGTVQLGLRELHRRFDPASPDWELLDRMMADDRPIVLELARRWLQDTAPLWSRDVDRAVRYLSASDAESRHLAVELALSHLRSFSDRGGWADRVLKELRDPHAETLEGIARV
ncbi:MAG: hypothetical protein N2C14_07610, partial [Planctomycetales bacterium]